MPNFMQYMDEDDEEFGPQQAPVLSSVQKEDLYQSILDKHDPEIAKAREAAARQKMIGGIGSALEGMGRAKGVARGGAGVDQSFYNNLGKAKDSGVDDAIGDRSIAVKKYLMDKADAAKGEQREYDRGRDTKDDEYRDNKLESDEKRRLAADERSEDWRERNYQQRERQFGVTSDRQNKAQAQRIKEGKEGKTITAGATTEIGELDAADKMIDDLASDYKENASDYASGITSKFPWSTDAGNYDQTRRQKAQMIGGILEGGKLTDPDFERYYSMMPSPWDTDAQAKNKLDELKQTLKIKRGATVETLGSAGFNVKGLSEGGSEQQKSQPFPGRLSPEDSQALDWAKANQGDPRAAKILERLGM